MITKEEVQSLGFACTRERSKENDQDGHWFGHGITIYEEFWNGEFNFATRVEDGEFKSGYGIKSKKHLSEIVKAITGNDLPDNSAKIVFSGELIKSGVKNANDRIYSEEALDQIVDAFNQSEKPVIGRLNPETGDPLMTDASHVVNKMNREKDTIKVEIEILNTTSGDIVRDLVNESNWKFAVRPSSMGRVDENGIVHIDKVLSYDIVDISNDSFKDILPPFKLGSED